MKTLLIVALLAASAFAQYNSLSRRYVPVTQRMSSPPLYELSVSEWTAFCYDRSVDEWRAIPFQFDQFNKKGQYDRDKDGIADATDEIIFMPKDAGDKAETWAWIDDESSQKYQRIELQLVDPLSPEDTAWVYLFRNVSSVTNVTSYLDYSPGPMGIPAADTIKSDAFILGHDKNGWIDYLDLPGSQGDIIDRFKLRLAGGPGVLISRYYEINEDFVEGETDADAVSYFPGPVRSFHIVKGAILIEKLNFPLLPPKSDFESNYEYTPYSFHIAAETDIDKGMLLLFGVKLIRQSLDFNENASGMKVYSSINRDGLLIDGEPDVFDNHLDPASSLNWVMAAGEQGAIIFIVNITPMPNSRRLLYYYDDQTGDSPPDSTSDTGDGRSFGDMGLMIQATQSALLPDKLEIDFKSYFIDQPNLDINFGEKLIAWEQHPLEMQATEQGYQPLAVAEQNLPGPANFYLAPAYPNPFTPTGNDNIHFELYGQKNDIYELIVYNVLGQRTVQISDIHTDAQGRGSVVWDGRDVNGEPLTPGLYFYRLTGTDIKQTYKMIITR